VSHPQLSDPAQAGIGHDPDLLSSSAHGDIRALALLYEAHGPAALHLAHRVLGDHTIAEDALRGRARSQAVAAAVAPEGVA